MELMLLPPWGFTFEFPPREYCILIPNLITSLWKVLSTPSSLCNPNTVSSTKLLPALQM